MGKARLRAGQSLWLKVKKAGGLLRRGSAERNHLPASGQKLICQTGGFRLGVLRRPPELRAVAGHVKLCPRADKTALRGRQGGVDAHGLGLQRRKLPAPQKGKLMLLGQTGKTRSGVPGHLRGGEQNRGFYLTALRVIPPLGQVRADIFPVRGPKRILQSVPPPFNLEPVFITGNAEWVRDFIAGQGKFSQEYLVYFKKI